MMSAQSQTSRLARVFVGDVRKLLALSIGSAAIGAGANLVRPDRLDWVYTSPAVRAVEAARRDQQVELRIVGLEEFRQWRSREGVAVLDARPALFYQFAHIPGARNLSKEEFDAQFAGIEPELRGAVAANGIVIYCSGGDCEDSAYVASRLTQQGFTKLAIFEGGWDEWQQAGGQ
jgi:rhodanese-related sulfurtransferase